MPMIDDCQAAIERALAKDGWRISQSQMYLQLGGRKIYIDLEATKNTNGQRQQLMLVEVKCFPEMSSREIYQAVGQYMVYRYILEEAQIQTPLFLAILAFAYEALFTDAIRQGMDKDGIKQMIVDINSEVIVEWIT